MSEALGLIETRGFIGAAAAADAMLKAASVTLVGCERLGNGFLTVIVRGEEEAVRAAVDEGSRQAEGAGELISAHVVTEPHRELQKLLPSGIRPPGAGLGR